MPSSKEELQEYINRKNVEKQYFGNCEIRQGEFAERMYLHMYETTVLSGLTDLDDIIDYYNTCLNEHQRHQVITNLLINELIEDEDTLNPYTFEPYKPEDAYTEEDISADKYIALFHAKYNNLSSDEQEEFIENYFTSELGTGKIIDTSSEFPIINYVTDTLMEVDFTLMNMTCENRIERNDLRTCTFDAFSHADWLIRLALSLIDEATRTPESPVKTFGPRSKEERLIATIFKQQPELEQPDLARLVYFFNNLCSNFAQYRIRNICSHTTQITESDPPEVIVFMHALTKLDRLTRVKLLNLITKEVSGPMASASVPIYSKGY